MIKGLLSIIIPSWNRFYNSKKEPIPKISLQRVHIFKGAGWNILAILVHDGFTFIVKLILARIILPEHFGLIAMSVVFTGLIKTINKLGFAAALIQKKDGSIRDIHYNTIFWAGLLFSALSFLITAIIIAPLVSVFYSEPLLHSIVIVLCIPILIEPLILIHRVKLLRKLEFKPVAIIEAISSVVAGIAGIIMALSGMGVWSIAFQGGIAALVSIPLMWKANPWIPRIRFSIKALKEIFNFGVFVLVKNITAFFAGNIDYLIIGKLMGSYYLGIYTLAFTLTDIFKRQLMLVINKVMLPVYAKSQDDPLSAGRYYLQIIRYNTILIFPIMIFINIFSEPIITLFFGTKWIGAVLSFQILSVAVMFHVATGSFSTVLTGLGKVKEDFFVYLIQVFLVTVPTLLLGIKYWGINGAAVAILVSKITMSVIGALLIKKYTKVRVLEIIKATIPATVGSIIIGIVSFMLIMFVKKPDNIIMLIGYSFVVMIIYTAVIFPFMKKDFLQIYRWFISRSNP